MSETNTYNFSGRAAVVTGAASGIGFEIARKLSEGGALVCLWDCNSEALEKSKAKLGNERITTVLVDVSDEASVREAATVTLAQQGVAASILVCSAGITGANATVFDYTVAEWERVMAINLRGVFLCNRALAPEMVKAGYGRIVNIASIAGKEGNPNASAYSVSKAGVIALTKSLGKELAHSGVTVNCVTPAAVHTAIFSQMTKEHIDYMMSKIPMGRFGKVEEVAVLVAWLSSADCSFTTGGVFDISGGRATY